MLPCRNLKQLGVTAECFQSDRLLEPNTESEDEGPAANQDPTSQKTKRRKPTQKLLRSLEHLPTTQRTITDPEVLANPDDYRLILLR